MGQKNILRILDDLSPSQLKLKDLPRKPESIHNMHFNEFGQLVKRKGFAEYNTDCIGAGSAHKISGMHRYYLQDPTDKEFIVAWNRGWYKVASAAGHAFTTLLRKSGTDFITTADMVTFWTDFKNRCYGVNTKGIWKYDKTYVRTVGITPPALKPEGTRGDTGELSAGDYKVKYTYVDEDAFESNGSDASVDIPVDADDKIVLTIKASGDDKVESCKIYRTSVNGATYYYDRDANNADEDVDLIQPDSTLILKSILHTDHTVPPTTPHLITKRRSRIIVAEDENTITAKLTDEYFPPELYFPTGNKQKVTGLQEQLTTLPVFTDDSLERLTGWDEDNYEFKNAFSNEGCVASRSLANCKNLLVYLGFDGIYYFNGTTGRKLDYKLSKYIMANIVPEFAHLSCGVYYEDKYLLTYPKTGSTVPNETVYYDFNTQTTGVYNLGFSCYSVWDKGGDTYSLKGGSNTIGRIYEVFNGLNDDTGVIACHDDVQGIDLGMPDRYKKWYGIFIKIKTTTVLGTTFRMYYTLDNADETYVGETLTKDTTAWYYIQFGSSSLLARSLAFRPYFSGKFDAEIQGYGLVFSLEPARWAK